MEVVVRDRRASDVPFLCDTYLKSWRTNKWAGVIPNNLYFEVQRTLFEDLLARGAMVKVAHFKDHDDEILGWAMGEVKEGKQVLHYVFTRDPYTKFDLVGHLIAALPGDRPGYITHKQYLISTKDYVHAPEIARRKSL